MYLTAVDQRMKPVQNDIIHADIFIPIQNLECPTDGHLVDNMGR